MAKTPCVSWKYQVKTGYGQRRYYGPKARAAGICCTHLFTQSLLALLLSFSYHS
jgi:hypothetical protein